MGLFTTIRNDCQHLTGQNLGPLISPLQDIITSQNKGLGQRPAMSNNSASSVSPATSPSPPLLNHGYRQQFNNWLQSQGWEDRFTWDKSQKSGPDNQPIWTVVGRCPFLLFFSSFA